MSEIPIQLPAIPYQDQVTIIAQPTNPAQLHVQAVRSVFIDGAGQPLEKPQIIPLDESAALAILLEYVKLRIASLMTERKGQILIAN